MNVRVVLFGFLMFAFTSAGHAGDKLSLKVSPAVAFAPANLTIRTLIEADPDNRSVRIAAESPDFYRSSEIPLNGDRAPRATMYELRGIPSGTYEVKATLFGPGGQERATARQEVEIVSSGDGTQKPRR
jgi:hypothetical protein